MKSKIAIHMNYNTYIDCHIILRFLIIKVFFKVFSVTDSFHFWNLELNKTIYKLELGQSIINNPIPNTLKNKNK